MAIQSDTGQIDQNKMQKFINIVLGKDIRNIVKQF